MAAALIIPASLLGFVTALVRLLAFNANWTEAALTYLFVCAVVPALILWVAKTSDMRREGQTPIGLPAQ
ncbi:MAG: hypothetical protein P8L68_16705 [Paracoccaceae bacterium]|nr:hypothetical protein [Paracoccaceae bacterium]MDG1737782.1 hypothetical protein [Paracoccaceae bacterium]MDG2260123.1 hypothetical protein [Paracoccaceae bacterium]